MWPLLKSGESLVVEVPREPVQLQQGDVGKLFIFKDNKEWVCHRYLGIHQNRHRFKGDFSTVYETYEYPHVLGEVLGFRSKRFTYYFKSGYFRSWFVNLQKRSILLDGKAKKRSRYISLLLALTMKPLFYSKAEPPKIIP